MILMSEPEMILAIDESQSVIPFDIVKPGLSEGCLTHKTGKPANQLVDISIAHHYLTSCLLILQLAKYEKVFFLNLTFIENDLRASIEQIKSCNT